MRQAALLQVSKGTRNELDGARRRRVAPFQDPSEDAQEAWADFSLRDALAFKVFVDLTRGGLGGAEACSFVLNGLDRVEKGWHAAAGGHAEVSPARALFSTGGEEIFIAREVYEDASLASYLDGRTWSVTWWGGTLAEIKSAIAFTSGPGRETVSLHLVDLSRAVREVLKAAKEAGLPEVADLKGLGQ